MNSRENQRGGAPVGLLAELPQIESIAVMCLRLWGDGPDQQAEVWNRFATSLGPVQGREALKRFEALCELCARFGRRPMIRHCASCKCIGADESCFANLIGYASEGAREDALLLATNLVRPDMAGALAGLAEEFGMALKRLSLRTPHVAGPPEQQPTLH